MKKKIYIFFASAAAIFLFLNNARGPIAAQQKGYTGAPGDEANTCRTCHNTGTFNPTAKIELFDSLGTTAVTQYRLDRQYTVRMTITAAAGTPAGYGFQMIDIRRRDSSNVKGFLPTAEQATNIGINTLTAKSRVYAEQSARLTSNVINVKWKAPSTDLGVIVFYGAGNCVDATGSFANDNGTPSASLVVNSPISAKTNELAENVNIQLSPNPTPNAVAIRLDSKVSRSLSLRISDLSGRAVISERWDIIVGDNAKSVDLKNLVPGAYMVQLLDSENIISKKIIKL